MKYYEFNKKYLKPYGFRYIKRQKGSHTLYMNNDGIKFGIPRFHNGNSVTDGTIQRFKNLIKNEKLQPVK